MRQSLANYFILNQSLIDLTSCAALLIYPYLNHPDLVEGSVAKIIFCKAWATKWFMWGLFQASTFNLICMAPERYVAILHPLLHMTRFNRRQAMIWMVLCWVLGLMSVGFYNIYYTNYKDGICIFMVDLHFHGGQAILLVYSSSSFSIFFLCRL